MIFCGGVSSELRKEVWPYLLNFVSWKEAIASRLADTQQNYETMIMEWMAVEAIVRQKDKELFEAGTVTVFART